jgi:anti-anti-sigma regulatory factor
MLAEGEMTMVMDGLDLVGGLDLEARRDFMTTVSVAIDRAVGNAGRVGLECSRVESLDDQTLGMLVTVARIAQRRGTRITLICASERARAQLDAAGVGHFFDWEPQLPDRTSNE